MPVFQQHRFGVPYLLRQLVKAAGSVSGQTKKVSFYGKPLTEELKLSLLLGCGQVLYWAHWLAASFDLTLGEVMAANVEKLKARHGERFTSYDELG